MIKNEKRKIIIGLAVLLCVLAATIGTLLLTRPATQAASITPAFVFNQSKAPSWWSGGNTNAQESVNPNEYDETINGPISKLPVANMTVHHGGPNDKPYVDNCFLSFSYYNYPLDDLAAAYSEHEERANKWGSSEQLDSVEQTITTPEGDKTYQLRHYRAVADSNSEEYLSGEQIGFIALDSGYLRVHGVCKTPTDLAKTIPVLSAVQLLP